MKRWDKTGCDTKKDWKEGVCGQKVSKQARGAHLLERAGCVAGSGMTLGGWHGTAIGARGVEGRVRTCKESKPVQDTHGLKRVGQNWLGCGKKVSWQEGQ